jgi:hypothetical protein
MQKELREAGDAGFSIVGMTVANTSFGGAELVRILQKAIKWGGWFYYFSVLSPVSRFGIDGDVPGLKKTA